MSGGYISIPPPLAYAPVLRFIGVTNTTEICSILRNTELFTNTFFKTTTNLCLERDTKNDPSSCSTYVIRLHDTARWRYLWVPQGRREWNSAFSAVSATITDMWLTFSSQLLPSTSSPKPIFALNFSITR